MVVSAQPPNQVPSNGIGTPRPLANTRAQNATRTTSAAIAFPVELEVMARGGAHERQRDERDDEARR